MAWDPGLKAEDVPVYNRVAADCDAFATAIESGEIATQWALAGTRGACVPPYSGGPGYAGSFGFGQLTAAPGFTAPADLAKAYGQQHAKTGEELKALAASLRALATVLRATASNYSDAVNNEYDAVRYIRQAFPKLPTVA
jgi:hypothetical protein